VSLVPSVTGDSFGPTLRAGRRGSLVRCEPAEPTSKAKDADPPASSVDARIAWIDDDEGVLGFVKELLTRHGFVVDCANNGAKGVELGCSGLYDVIGLDLKLPDLPGVQVIRTLRSRGVQTPVFVLTGYFADDALISSAWRAGAAECRAKPIRARPLLELVHGILDDSARRRVLAEGNPVAPLLVWLESLGSPRGGRTRGSSDGDFVGQLQARLLTAAVASGIPIPSLLVCARAFTRTLATETPWATLADDVRELLQDAAQVSPTHPQLARAVARLEALPSAIAAPPCANNE
jgi:DNA-binding response OmpR family regulator